MLTVPFAVLHTIALVYAQRPMGSVIAFYAIMIGVILTVLKLRRLAANWYVFLGAVLVSGVALVYMRRQASPLAYVAEHGIDWASAAFPLALAVSIGSLALLLLRHDFGPVYTLFASTLLLQIQTSLGAIYFGGWPDVSVSKSPDFPVLPIGSILVGIWLLQVTLASLLALGLALARYAWFEIRIGTPPETPIHSS